MFLRQVRPVAELPGVDEEDVLEDLTLITLESAVGDCLDFADVDMTISDRVFTI